MLTAKQPRLVWLPTLIGLVLCSGQGFGVSLTVVNNENRDPATTWWVYLLQCRDGSLYTGITIDVDARLAAHNSGDGASLYSLQAAG